MAAECPYRAGRKDGPLKCTWFPGTTEASPHTCKRTVRPKTLDSVLQAVGDTPLVRIERIAKEEDLKCELLVKAEFFNAGGSVKDRIGLRMVQEAERLGKIKPGDVLIEPTSGNTGIGIALAAAVKGYRCIITLPEKMSAEKVAVLKALGAEIVRTPTEAAFDSPESHIGVAERLHREIPNSHILDQYTNPGNPLAHYDGTAVEILEQTEGKIDMVVVGAGTGGTITGIARRIKEVVPSCVVVGVDPKGSILAEPDSLNDEDRLVGYQVEGTGYDFIPTVLDRDIVDVWEKTTDRESFVMARRLIRTEGLLCGGSSGANVSAAIRALRKAGLDVEGKRIVAILPDSIRNYLSKFADDDWMWAHGFVDEARGIGCGGAADSKAGEWWSSHAVSALELTKPCTVGPEVTVKAAVSILADNGFGQLPVVSADGGDVLGVVTEGNLAAKMASGRVKASDTVASCMFKQFRTVSLDTPLRDLARVFDRDHFALATSKTTSYEGAAATPRDRTAVAAVVTRIDLLKYVASKEGDATTEAATE